MREKKKEPSTKKIGCAGETSMKESAKASGSWSGIRQCGEVEGAGKH